MIGAVGALQIRHTDLFIKSQGAALAKYKQLCSTTSITAQQCTIQTANTRIKTLEGKISAKTATINAHKKSLKDYKRLQRRYETLSDDFGKEKNQQNHHEHTQQCRTLLDPIFRLVLQPIK